MQGHNDHYLLDNICHYLAGLVNVSQPSLQTSTSNHHALSHRKKNIITGVGFNVPIKKKHSTIGWWILSFYKISSTSASLVISRGWFLCPNVSHHPTIGDVSSPRNIWFGDVKPISFLGTFTKPWHSTGNYGKEEMIPPKNMNDNPSNPISIHSLLRTSKNMVLEIMIIMDNSSCTKWKFIEMEIKSLLTLICTLVMEIYWNSN